MGLLKTLARLVRGSQRQDKRPVRRELENLRLRRFESMEPRRMLDADPLQIGAVYIEEDLGSDVTGDTFEVTFQGGAPGTVLTQLVIDTDQGEPGFGEGDVIFDSSPGGFGTDNAFDFEIVSPAAQDPAATAEAHVEDGSTLLTIDLSGFQSGDKLVFAIDVDEVEDFDPAETDPVLIADGIDPITSGVEFQGSQLTAIFQAPHYHDITGSGEFRNRYDAALAGTELDLPEDNHNGLRDRTDGVVIGLQQQPLPVAISGTVFLDHDLDLEQDGSEQGLDGVELGLWQKDGDQYVSTGHTTRTDADGDFDFGFDLNLEPGTFQVRETQPSGLFSVGAVPGTVVGLSSGAIADGDPDRLTAIELPLGGQQAVDFDFAEARPAAISGNVFHDRSNDGVRDAGEEGIEGVEVQVIPLDTIAPQGIVTLTTGADGSYSASGLAPGRYRVVETSQPNGFFDGLDAAGLVGTDARGAVANPGDNLEDILLQGGDEGVEYNFGELAPAAIEGRVHLSGPDGDCFRIDVDHTPLANVTIHLVDAQGNQMSETKTDSEGRYRFDNLMPGVYSVAEVTPAGLINGGAHVGQINNVAVGQTPEIDVLAGIAIGSGQTAIGYDFCEHLPAAISGHVYHDENNDAHFDTSEDPIAGVVVSLRDHNSNLVAETVTNTLGEYQFGGLSAGQYVIEESHPDGWMDGQDSVGSIAGIAIGSIATVQDKIEQVELQWGDTGTDYDFGELAAVKIGGFVYHDRNDNGLREPGEEGLAGVAVHVIPTNPFAPQDPVTVVTDASGMYMTGDLAPGHYQVVEVNQPAGFFDGLDTAGSVDGQQQGLAGNPGDELDSILLNSGEQGVEYNFGELAPVAIGGFVYHDRDNDGIRDSGEEGLAGVSVHVIALDTIAPQDTVTLLTDAQGMYLAERLAPGSYRVIENEQPIGFFDGLDTAGTVDGLPRGSVVDAGDDIEGIQLASGESGVEYNFGEIAPASIRGRVHLSGPDPQCFIAGVEPVGVEGALIQLINENGETVAETRTDAAGDYVFDRLLPGVYSVVETTPDGLIDGAEHLGQVDGAQLGQQLTNDSIREIRVGAGQDATGFDFCEHLPASLSGHVYHDRNNNGVRDSGEEAIAATQVSLVDAGGQMVASSLTDGGGRYTFTGLRAGVYSIVEQQPDGWLDGRDSAGTVADSTSGLVINEADQIDQVTLKWGQAGIDYDFGELQAGSIAGLVHSDPNRNCQFDLGEQAIGGVTIRLLDSDGATIATTLTDSNGRYEFTGLAPGEYAVFQEQPDGYFHGGQRTDAADGDVASADLIANIELASGELVDNNDFCEVPPASIAGVVHTDLDGDCQLDQGEAGIAGVAVELINEQGDVVASTQTDSQGRYRFEDLVAGRYSIRELQPAEYFHGGQQLGFAGGELDGEDVLTLELGPGQVLVDYNFCEEPVSSLSGFVFQDGPPIVTADGLPPENLAAVRDGARTSDDTAIAGVVLELRDGLSGEPIRGSEALPGFYPSGAIRATTDANGFYEFAGLQGGRDYGVFQIHPDGFIDGVDTPGTASGIAINPNVLLPSFLEQLVVNPRNDAIVSIALGVGQSSRDNNFSEVLVESEPASIPPINPDPPGESIPPAPLPPLVSSPPTFIGFVRPTFNFPYSSDGPTLLVGGGGLPYSWHLSVINAGTPRGTDSAAEANVGSWFAASYLEVVRWRPEDLQDAHWTIVRDVAGGGEEQSTFAFGIYGGIPVAGDFNGDGIDEVGVYFGGEWFIDLNGDGRWDERDVWAKLGDENDLPVTGDWDGDGKDDVGIFGPEWLGDPDAIEVEPGLPDAANARRHHFKNVPPKSQDAADGYRLLQLHANGTKRADVIDHVFRYGESRDVPVAGDWNGDGIRAIGIFRDGRWQLDADGDGRWTRHDAVVTFGQAGDLPVVGDFSGDGIEQIGVYRNGTWYLDTNHNYELDAHDKVFEMGGAADMPVAGDWDGDGVDEPGLYRPGRPSQDEVQ